MSKFSKTLNAQLKDKQHEGMDYVDCYYELDSIGNYIPTYKSYKVGTTFEYSIQCRDADDLDKVVYEAKRALVEELFGEFRKPLNIVFEKLHNRDVQGAKQELNKMYTQMFEVE